MTTEIPGMLLKQALRLKPYKPLLADLQKNLGLHKPLGRVTLRRVLKLKQDGWRGQELVDKATELFKEDFADFSRHFSSGYSPLDLLGNQSRMISNLEVLREVNPELYGKFLAAARRYVPSPLPPYEKWKLAEKLGKRYHGALSRGIRSSQAYKNIENPLIEGNGIQIDRGLFKDPGILDMAANGSSNLFPISSEYFLDSKHPLAKQLRRVLLKMRSDRFSSPRSSMAVRKLIRRTDFGFHRPGNNAAVSNVDWKVRPRIALEVTKDPATGKYFVNRNALQHEFGHILDLHGYDKSFGASSGSRHNSISQAPYVGNYDIDKEIAANLAAGLPARTPWVDTYILDYGKGLRPELFRKYKDTVMKALGY